MRRRDERDARFAPSIRRPPAYFSRLSGERLPSPRSRPPDIAADDPLPPLPLRPTRSWCSFRAAMRARRLSSSRTMTRAPPPPLRSRPRVRSRDLPSQGENHGHGGVLAGAAQGSTGSTPRRPSCSLERDHRACPGFASIGRVVASRRVRGARPGPRDLTRENPISQSHSGAGLDRFAALGGALTVLPSPSQPSR